MKKNKFKYTTNLITMNRSLIAALLYLIFMGNAVSQTPTVQVEHHTKMPGTQVEIPVQVTDFDEVASISLFIAYDHALLDYVGALDPALDGMIINAFVDYLTGIPQVGIQWVDFAGNGVELPDGNLVTLLFDYSSGTSPFSFLTEKTDIGVVQNDDPVSINVNHIDGSISSLSDATVSIADVFSTQGIVNVPVTVTGFDNIGAFSLQIDYPTANIDFEQIENKLPFLSENGTFYANVIKAGRLAVGWSKDIGSDPLSLANGGKLFDLQFDFSGGEADITFNVSACEVSDATDDLNSLPAEYINGSITEGSSFSIKVFLEGFYNSQTGEMNKTKDYDTQTGSTFDKFDGTIVDLITVELHSEGSYGEPVYRFKEVELHKDGFADLVLPFGGSYYLTIRHRNHIETVSANPINLSTTSTYDFTTAANKAFGDNMQELQTGVWGLFAGDVAQTGTVVLTDIVQVNAAARANDVGYIVTDVNGDGQVNLSDIIIVNARARAGIVRQIPN